MPHPASPDRTEPPAHAHPLARTIGRSLRSLALLVTAALLVRSLVVAPFGIPSESMLPLLRVGDVLLVAKWPYGWSRDSLPFAPPLFTGRLWGRTPLRGDVVLFRDPTDPGRTVVKRVIGLPGDRVRIRRGQVILNGKAVPQSRVADLLVPVTPASPCREEAGLALRRERQPDGTIACRYLRYRETLPGGRAYAVIDLGRAAAADDVAAVSVPAGRLFLLGDNRDRSADSRFPTSAGGIGLVRQENLLGRAALLLFSQDGSAIPSRPSTWWASVREDRIGTAL